MPRCFSLPAILIACTLFFAGPLHGQVMSESAGALADNNPSESTLESTDPPNTPVPQTLPALPEESQELADNRFTEQQGVPPRPAVAEEVAAHSCNSPPCSAAAPAARAAEAPINPCPADPARAFPALGRRPLLELLAVDIARRSLLAVHPHAAYFPICTKEVQVRNQGHYVRTYVRLSWFRQDHPWRIFSKPTEYEAQSSASIVYHPERRRVSDLSYTDNARATFRNVDRASQVVATYNEQFNMLDDAGITAHFLGEDIQVLQPARRQFLGWNLPFQPPHPREKSLRTVRTDGNVTANQ